MRRPGSKDPHRREQKLYYRVSCNKLCILYFACQVEKMAQIFEYEDMFKWPGHKLSEASIDFTFLMILFR